MNDLTTYRAVRDQIQPGDVIAFGGSGFISDAIKFFTRSSVSHVGMVLEAEDRGGERIVKLFESTTLSGRKGVQINPLSVRLATYGDGARAWWLPLSGRARAALDLGATYSFCIEQMGDGYDYAGLFAFMMRHVPGAGMLFHRGDDSREFCSELVAEAFRAGGLLHGVDVYECSPQRLCEMSIYDKAVQLMGKPQGIRRFNTV